MRELLDLGFEDVSQLTNPGIYILCYRGEVRYIGQSTKPFKRIGQHNPNFKFDSVYFKPCRTEDLIAVERNLIRKLKPKANGISDTHIPCAKSDRQSSWLEKSQRRFSNDSIQIAAAGNIKLGDLEFTLRKKQPR